MSSTKRILHNQLDRWKQAAQQLMSGTEHMEDGIVLDPVLLEKCQKAAEERQLTVSEVVHQILERHWAQIDREPAHEISREQSERNPILLLDALTQRNFTTFGETAYE